MKIIQLVLSSIIIFAIPLSSIEAAPAVSACHRQECVKLCNSIVADYAANLSGEKKLPNNQVYDCHRLDPSEGLQRQSAGSMSGALSLKDQGYTCYAGLPGIKTYYSNCYNTCLANPSISCKE